MTKRRCVADARVLGRRHSGRPRGGALQHRT